MPLHLQWNVTVWALIVTPGDPDQLRVEGLLDGVLPNFRFSARLGVPPQRSPVESKGIEAEGAPSGNLQTCPSLNPLTFFFSVADRAERGSLLSPGPSRWHPDYRHISQGRSRRSASAHKGVG